MNTTIKLLIPVALGLGAGLLNLMLMSRARSETQFVRAKAEVAFGTELTAEALEPFAVPKREAASLTRSAVPWEDRGRLLGQLAARRLEQGDPLFWRDVQSERVRPEFGADEELRSIDVREVTMARKLYNVGDIVQLVFRVEEGQQVEEGRVEPIVSSQSVGPFRIAALGEMFEYDPQWNSQEKDVETMVLVVAAPGKDTSGRTKQLDDLLDAVQRRTAVLMHVTPQQFAGGSPTASTAKQRP